MEMRRSIECFLHIQLSVHCCGLGKLSVDLSRFEECGGRGGGGAGDYGESVECDPHLA